MTATFVNVHLVQYSRLQSDEALAAAVLGQAIKDLGKKKTVGYVNVLGIAPLDRRHVIWEKTKKSPEVDPEVLRWQVHELCCNR